MHETLVEKMFLFWDVIISILKEIKLIINLNNNKKLI